MKTREIVAVVVLIHCVVLGTVLLGQGCRSSSAMAPSERAVVTAPPATEPAVVETAVPPVTEVAVPTDTAKTDAGQTTAYVVRKGDTLNAIAKHFGVRAGDILALNGLSNANKLRVGQKIELPGIHDVTSLPPVHATHKATHKAAKDSSSAKADKTTAKAADAAGGNTYVIKKGDTLGKIAKATGSSTEAIKKANHMSSDKLTVGKKLTIPTAESAQPTAPTAGGAETPAPDSMTAAPTSTPAPDALPPSTIAKPGEIDTTGLGVDEEATKGAAAGASKPAASATAPQTSATPPAPGAASAAATPDYKIIVVTGTEDISTIAIQWGVTEDDIRKLNGLGPNEQVKPGQKLKIMPAH